MGTLFLTILNMSLTGAFVIAAICLARQLLKKAPKIISYVLWAVAGFRLVFPFTIESMFSLIPFNTAPIPTDIAMQSIPPIDSGIPIFNNAVSNAAYNVFPAAAPYYSTNPLQILITIGAWVWFLGAIALVVYGVVSFIILKHKMRKSVWKESNIYEADNIKSPFVLGVISPKIFLPVGLSEHERRYILLHEQTHIRRYDHILKFAAYFILCLHWFNPLAWLAFWLMGADMEMSCDERVIKELGNDISADYSMSLIRIATGMRIANSNPLAFGEGGIKERVKRVMNFKKSSRLVIVMAVTLASVLSMGFAMNRTTGAFDEPDNHAEVFEAPDDIIQDEDDMATDYEHSQLDTQGIMIAHNNLSIISGSINSVFRNGSLVSIAGNEGVVVIFNGSDGVWFIPYGEEINIANGEPFRFDDWLYETWGVTVDAADMDYLLEKTYLERRVHEFNIMMHLGNPTTEKLLELFTLSAELRACLT